MEGRAARLHRAVHARERRALGRRCKPGRLRFSRPLPGPVASGLRAATGVRECRRPAVFAPRALPSAGPHGRDRRRRPAAGLRRGTIALGRRARRWRRPFTCPASPRSTCTQASFIAARPRSTATRSPPRLCRPRSSSIPKSCKRCTASGRGCRPRSRRVLPRSPCARASNAIWRRISPDRKICTSTSWRSPIIRPHAGLGRRRVGANCRRSSRRPRTAKSCPSTSAGSRRPSRSSTRSVSPSAGSRENGCGVSRGRSPRISSRGARRSRRMSRWRPRVNSPRCSAGRCARGWSSS